LLPKQTRQGMDSRREFLSRLKRDRYIASFNADVRTQFDKLPRPASRVLPECESRGDVNKDATNERHMETRAASGKAVPEMLISSFVRCFCLDAVEKLDWMQLFIERSPTGLKSQCYTTRE
jgi:hypothetical protein